MYSICVGRWTTEEPHIYNVSWSLRTAKQSCKGIGFGRGPLKRHNTFFIDMQAPLVDVHFGVAVVRATWGRTFGE